MPLARRTLLALAALLPGPILAPPRGVALILPFAPGGATDIAARLIQEALGRALGAPVVVENRPGARGAVATRERSRAFPELPTLHESGLEGFNAGSWTMAVAPAGTPAPVVMRLNAAVNAALAEPELARRLAEIGTEPVATSTPESAAAHVRAEIARWREVVRAGNLRLERG
ncbi:MAG: tripartite tricarboxylate transporter substrate-binding protein [Roseococcus sp.]|jgi:tripartite-type tricarboxylate transporter receptor subunit TctC